MLTLTKAVALMSRPHLITPKGAAEYLPRLLNFDPRVANHSEPLELVSRLAHTRPAVMDDDDDDRRPRKPTRPAAYRPNYIGEPEAVSEAGWSLKSGIGMICVDTPLVDKGFGICGVWFHGYDSIEAAIREMDADERVKAIFFKWDSPGGVVAPGLYDLTAYLQKRATSGNSKPLWSYADMACSGAYWLASPSSRFICHEAAFVGSIGAVFTHYSRATMLERAGVTITPIQFGAHKTDGADYKLLDDSAKADIQAEIDQIGEDFIATVAAGRGDRFTAEQARATQARVFTGRHADKSRDALALGLVDAVMPEPEAFAALLDAVRPSNTIPANPAGSIAARAATPKPAKPTGATMEMDMKRAAKLAAIEGIQRADAKSAEEKLEEIRNILDQDDEDETPPDPPEEEVETETEEEKEAKARARQPKPAAAADGKARIKAILALPEAKGRDAQAQHIALETDLTVEQAKGVLAASPKASRLADRVTDPNVQAGNAEDKRTDVQKESQAAIRAAGIRVA